MAIIILGGAMYEFCAPCRDKVAKAITMKSADIIRDEECRFFGVAVNGTSIDLAYTYLLDNGEYRNLLAKIQNRTLPCYFEFEDFKIH